MVEDESVHESKKLPPDWIYNFDDSRLNIKTLTLDIDKNGAKKDNINNQQKYKITPVPSVNEKISINEKIKNDDQNSFKNK